MAELAKPGSADLAIWQGSTLALAVTLTVKSSGAAVDLTGLTFASQVREDTSARAKLLATIVVTLNDPATDGVLNLSSDDVATLAEGDYVYDIYCNEWKRFVLAGSFSVNGTATRV